MKATDKICLLLLGIVSLTGCRYRFDIEDNGLKPCMCIKSFICADSLVNVDVYKAVPVQYAGKTDMSIVSPSYSLKRNGKEVETSSKDIENYGINLQCEEFSKGDRLEITFCADGVEPAAASTVIPGNFPEFTYRTYRDEDDNWCILLEYKDDKDSRDYYGASVETRRTFRHGHNPLFVTYGFASLPYAHNDVSLDQFAYAPVVSRFGAGDMYIWADEDREDDTYEIKYIIGTEISETTEFAVRLHLFKLSKEMYHHLYADYDCSYNPFSYVGFSSPSFAYSNVMKGCGYFCAYSKDYSDWMITYKK